MSGHPETHSAPTSGGEGQSGIEMFFDLLAAPLTITSDIAEKTISVEEGLPAMAEMVDKSGLAITRDVAPDALSSVVPVKPEGKKATGGHATH